MEGYCVWFMLLLSANVHSISSRGLNPKDEELLVQILSAKAMEMGKLLQSGRVLLHKIREWHGAHPAESVLAKCALHYWIEVKLSGIATPAEEDGYEAGRRGLSTPVWIERPSAEDGPQSLPNFQDFNTMRSASNRIFNYGGSEGKSIQTGPSPRSFNDDEEFNVKRKVVKSLYLLYMELRDILSEYKLIGCSVHYLIAKFWEWVDSAP